MTRGNQRDLARAKNQKKQAANQKSKGKEDGLSKEQRMQRDAEIMRQKQKAKETAKQDAGSSKK